MKKPKYKIGERLYYYDISKKQIKGMYVYKIIITKTQISYADKFDKTIEEESLKRTVKKLIQKVLGKEYAYAKVFELLVQKF